MVLELERKSEKPVMGKVKTEKMIVTSVEGGVVRGVGGDGCTTSTSQAFGVMDKKIIPGSEAENPEINVIDGVNHGVGDDGNATEDPSGNSSSFEDTFSGVNGLLGLSDDEINSEFRGGGQSPWAFLGYEEPFMTRNKKLTRHWRNFIRPVMWRCKWAELQMKMLQSQASVYSKILAEYDQERQSQLKNFSAESQCSRLLPFPHQMKRKKIMQRKKRKRIEETTDIASYMGQHNLFTYCENKGTLTENAQLINGLANPAAGPAVRNIGITLANNDYLLQFGSKETSLERVLAKIDSMQSLVHSMTARVDKVINDNPRKFPSLNRLSLLAPCDSGASSAQDPTTPTGDKEKVLVTYQCMTTQPASDLRSENCIIPTSPVATEQVEDTLPHDTESGVQPVTENETVNDENEVLLKQRPIKDNLIVYRRGTLSGKKRRLPSEDQPRPSSNVQAENEKLGDYLASRLSSLRNNQKKRGKTTGARSGRKQSKCLNLAFGS